MELRLLWGGVVGEVSVGTGYYYFCCCVFNAVTNLERRFREYILNQSDQPNGDESK